MKDFKLTISSLGYLVSELTKLVTDSPNKSFRVSVGDYSKSRSISANNQQHLWYAQIAKHYGDRSALDVKNHCKDALGLPILLQSEVHADKIEFLLHKLDYYKHSYESKMKLISCLEVTSLFSAKESKQYMDQMIYYFNDLGVNIKYKDK